MKLFFWILATLFIWGCSSEEDPMTDAEKYMADKFNAEWTDITLQQTETKTNGRVTENRNYIAVRIKNAIDIDRILEQGAYAEKRMKSVTQFVLDSIEFGEMLFVPNEIEVNYIKEGGFWIFKNETKQTMSFNLN